LLPKNPSYSKLKENNHLLDDLESFEGQERPYDEQVLADVCSKKEDIKFTIKGRVQAAVNLQKELDT
jgi:hypothetical protein